jgi:ligand-binding sensor domain-containing protein
MRCIPRFAVCLIAFLLLSAVSLPAQRWQTYTNTNNVTDAVLVGTKLYTATWGGVVEYDLLESSSNLEPLAQYVRTITSVDGLADNDVRTLAYEAGTGDIWAGTYNSGITIIRSSGLQNLDATSGLPSDKVRRILVHESFIYVATDLGISQFYYLHGVYFPLLLHQYNSANTQGGLIDNDVLDITIAANSYLYCATASGVSFVHSDSLDIDSAWHQWSDANSPLPAAPILSISAGLNYVAMNSMTSVHRHDVNPFTNDWQTWTRSNSNLADSVFTVRMPRAIGSDNIYLAYGIWDENTMTLTRKIPSPLGTITSDGIVYPIPGEPIELGGNYEIPSACVFRMLSNDWDMNIYATWGQGVYVNKGLYTYKLINDCPGFQTVTEIVTDANHNMWLGSGWLGGPMTRKGTRGVSKWDGNHWTNYSISNSPLPVDNIRSLAVDANNHKWFGSWDVSTVPFGWRPGAVMFNDADDLWQWYTRFGIRYYDEVTGWSDAMSGTPRLFNNTIADIYCDRSGNLMISSSGGGITVFDSSYDLVGTFQMPSASSVYQSVSLIYDSGSRYFFGLNADDKLMVWDHPSLPNNTENHWVTGLPNELNAGFVYGVVSLVNVFGEEENWIATSQGLFMWDGVNWYKYDTDIKRRRFVNNTWINDTLYYVDEERLYGSVRTTPTALFLDPFNRIWIGTLEHGLTMYDPETERFTNYYQGNAPLLSNYITCFGYDPIAGNLLIGTPDGLNTLEIGIQYKTEDKLGSVKAFPNPYFPSRGGSVRLVNLPSLSMPAGENKCRIYDVSGALVIELKENYFARFDWDGLNKNRKKCSSGIYYFVVTAADGTTQRGKIALIREN